MRKSIMVSLRNIDLTLLNRIRLATNLYSEQLLDRDHYLDWAVSGIEHCTQSKMPMWIIIAQIYWNDIMRSRKYGRRLVYALLSHLHTVSSFHLLLALEKFSTKWRSDI